MHFIMCMKIQRLRPGPPFGSFHLRPAMVVCPQAHFRTAGVINDVIGHRLGRKGSEQQSFGSLAHLKINFSTFVQD